MAEAKQVHHKAHNDDVVERARDFWFRHGRTVLIALGAIILVVGGWLAYKYLIKEPNERKAEEAIWKVQDYYQQDSAKQVLNGDKQYPGAEKIASQYSGTKAGELADFYAATAAWKLGDYNKVVKHLKDFSTNAGQVQARAYKLLGDAYANLGKNSDALSSYKKAAHEFEDDKQASSEYLFYAAYFADRVVKDKKEAIDLYKEIEKKYPNTRYSAEAEKYLGQAGVYKSQE
jgi:predicted negative regulator of RcsB-dependent stress response